MSDDSSPLRWSAIGPDAWVVQRGGGNTTVLREPGGAVVVDLKLGGVGDVLARDIRARVGAIQAVIITHHHADHSEGLSGFDVERSYIHRAGPARIRADFARTTAAARANADGLVDRIFADLARDFEYPRTPATEADVRRFVTWASQAGPEAQAPTDLIGDTTTLRVGRTALEVVHVGPAHTDNDVYVVDRRRSLLITGDLVFHRHHPFIDVDAGATTVGWQRAVAQVAAAAPAGSTLVPGHGPVTDMAALTAQSRYFEAVRRLVAQDRRAGRTKKEITSRPNTLFPDWAFADLWESNLGILYDEGGRDAPGI